MTDIDHPPYKVPAYDGEDYTTSAVCEAIYALWSEKGTEGVLDGDDPLGDNIKRAKKASDAIETYAEASGIYDGENIFLAISDFMNDLRHLLDFVRDADNDGADGYPITFEELAARDLHYADEIEGVL